MPDSVALAAFDPSVSCVQHLLAALALRPWGAGVTVWASVVVVASAEPKFFSSKSGTLGMEVAATYLAVQAASGHRSGALGAGGSWVTLYISGP